MPPSLRSTHAKYLFKMKKYIYVKKETHALLTCDITFQAILTTWNFNKNWKAEKGYWFVLVSYITCPRKFCMWCFGSCAPNYTLRISSKGPLSLLCVTWLFLFLSLQQTRNRKVEAREETKNTYILKWR
jgi:hypothetical protein